MTSETSNPVKKYIFRQNQWIISYTSDPGIIQTMASLNAKQETRQNASGEKKAYWFLPNEAFQSIKHILDGSGYAPHESAPREPSAAFRVPASARPQTEVKDLPANNPIRNPQVSHLDSNSASEFAKNHTFSVSEFNRDFKAGLAAAFPHTIWISGEITNLQVRNGHAYFLLVEHCNGSAAAENYSLDAIIWRGTYHSFMERVQQGSLPQLSNGQKVRVCGSVDFYPQSGRLSFIVKDIDDKFAEGEFYKQKEIVWNELKNLNLHEKNLNLPMPVLPLRLAVFTKTQSKTSDEAAGWGDFYKIVSASGFPFQITTFSVAVQGVNVESTILGAFDTLEKIGAHNFDLAFIIRGGGSITDLACFNNLHIAKRIAMMPLKFVIAIGHEKDRCVLDEIAARTPTPTAAAEMLCRICADLTRQLGQARDRIVDCASEKLSSEKSTLELLSNKCATISYQKKQAAISELQDLKSGLSQKALNILTHHRIEIQKLAPNLQNAANQYCSDYRNQIVRLQNDVSAKAHQICVEHSNILALLTAQMKQNASSRIHHEHMELMHRISQITDRTQSCRESQKSRLDNLSLRLDALNPESQLKRGFVLISDSRRNRISSIQDVTPNDTIHIRMMDGKLTATVNAITPDTDKN